eukprot:31172-Pelagococcus_subviridis.AAC.2
MGNHPRRSIESSVHVHAQGYETRPLAAHGVALGRAERGGRARRGDPPALARDGAHGLAPRRRVARRAEVLQRTRGGARGGGRGSRAENKVSLFTPVPVRPRRRGERRSLRTFSPGARLSPPRVPRFRSSRHARRDAFQLQLTPFDSIPTSL